MQFHPNLGIAAGYHMHFSALLGSTVSIAVYSGSQPTAADYCTNLITSYTYNAGTQLLAVYGASSASQSAASQVNTDTSGTTGVTQLAEVSTAYGMDNKRAGTASWAVVFSDIGAWTYVRNNTTTPLDQSAVYFMIVPVTDVTGNGVVQFSTTAFDGSTYLPIMAYNFTPSIV